MHLSSFPHRSPSGSATTAEFAMAFTSTPRGARLARLFVSHCLNSWGHPCDSDVNETLTRIAAELCANAVRHGRVPGRNFHVRLTREADGERLRLEVSDARAERRPSVTDSSTDPVTESGRGLLLVTALADGWGVTDRRCGPGKTVWVMVSAAALRQTSTASPDRLSAEPCASGLTGTTPPYQSDDAPKNAKRGRDVSGPA
ncbi:ATP-binding protein [Streptomyces sp. NPDC052107]|uniref:ATP-binding protein n=1 Tax=Streptomyces sp. NPDC052107 TaxID=3155632 RepID=UPI003426D253